MHPIKISPYLCLILCACDPIAPTHEEKTLVSLDRGLDKLETLNTPMALDDANNNPNSLWQSGSKEFFTDQRAQKLGDTVVVRVNINNEQANINNTQNINKPQSAFNNNSLPAILNQAGLPGLLNFSNSNNFNHKGNLSRKEMVNLSIPARLIKQVNNCLWLIYGNRQLKISNEIIVIEVAGIINPLDINQQNEIDFKYLAQARLYYGAQGFIVGTQYPPLLSSILGKLHV